MPELEYFMIAEQVVIDQATNMVSLINLLEDLDAPADSFPFALAKLTVITSWRRAPDEAERNCLATLRLTMPGRAIPYEFPTEFTFDLDRIRNRFVLDGIPVEGVGAIQFEILLDGVAMGARVVRVSSAKSV